MCDSLSSAWACVTRFKKEAKIGKIGPDFLYICTTTGATAKRMAPVDSAHQIGLATLLIDVLTVDEGVSQIGRVFEYGATPSGDMLKRMAQRRYAQTDGTSGFSASNRSSYPLDRRSDCR